MCELWGGGGHVQPATLSQISECSAAGFTLPLRPGIENDIAGTYKTGAGKDVWDIVGESGTSLASPGTSLTMQHYCSVMHTPDSYSNTDSLPGTSLRRSPRCNSTGSLCVKHQVILTTSREAAGRFPCPAARRETERVEEERERKEGMGGGGRQERERGEGGQEREKEERERGIGRGEVERERGRRERPRGKGERGGGEREGGEREEE